MRKPSDTVQLSLRLKESLRRQIEESAREHNVSINADTTERLRRSFDLGEMKQLEMRVVALESRATSKP